ncbi:SH3 domain-containing protein [Alkalibacterium pelagium]|uniref:Beta-N-acetylglucosaminidase n=1 Tax=Alkalibacterium pelagium TaxID=426702 RepID=A0A1H7NNH1_9LACT|nr:SH3 domain-containing protein [Alkalibacterium pelagium]GEN51436.1 hypothetical protein APE02nite_21010 [Alkalibacterium pelagium]SEL24548.1 Beta-N-acetylglucosaminidase [Alkalibacterium pelagium]
MNNWSHKKNIKKVLIASMFASTLLGVDSALAEEKEPEMSLNNEQTNDLSIDEVKIELSEDKLATIHTALNYHIDGEFEDALSIYETLVEENKLEEYWLDVIVLLRNLSEEKTELNLDTLLELDLIEEEYLERLSVLINTLDLELESVDEAESEDEGTEETDETESIENDKELELIVDESEEESDLVDEEDDLEQDVSETEESDDSVEEDSNKNEEVEEEAEVPADDKDSLSKIQTFSVSTSSTRPSATTLYNNSINAGNATEAWQNAVELNRHYPNDYRVSIAFESASNRIFSLAQSNHRNRNYNTALRYYNQLLNHPHVPIRIQNSLNRLITMANSQIRLGFASTYYNDVINAPTATAAWIAAMEYKSLYPTDDRLSEAVNSAGQRIFSMGRSSQRSNRFEDAHHYYSLLVEETLLDQSLMNNALSNLAVVKNEMQTSASDLFDATINASSATEAWNNLGRLIARFPNHNRLAEAVEHASARVYSMGRSNHRAGRQSNAQLYYSWLLDESRVSQNMRNLVSAHQTQLNNGWDFRTPEDYLRDTNAASTASEAWAVATEGITLFPDHIDVQMALNNAADRMYALGQSNHRRGNFNTAITYYNQVINQGGVLAGIQAEAQVFRRQAENRRVLTTANQFYNQSTSAGTASEAWDIANEGLSYYPNHSQITEALQLAADRVMALGESNHKRGRFSTATTYYNRLLNNENISQSMRTRLETYRYLSTNNLYLTNMIVRESTYSTSFNDAVNRQMALNAKPQASSNGGWRNATREEVVRYMDPNNFLPSDMSDMNSLFTTARVIVDVLNVRSGPGTGHSLVGTVTRGQEFTILEERSGWFKIGFNGSEAWISGSSNFVDANREMLQFLNLQGTVGVSIENLNRELQGTGILEGHGAAFRQASIEANVNEIYLISHAILETGRGTSRLATGVLVEEVNGQKVTPRIVYNMFGIGAVDHAPVRLGAERAYQEGWFTPEASIIGGAKWISTRYVNNATHQQNTLYKMRWNPASPGTHQYATDVGWASKQTSMLRSIVSYSLMDNLILNFDIPRY